MIRYKRLKYFPDTAHVLRGNAAQNATARIEVTEVSVNTTSRATNFYRSSNCSNGKGSR